MLRRASGVGGSDGSADWGDVSLDKTRANAGRHLKSVPAPEKTQAVLAADPREGAKLIRAFLKVEDPNLREAIVAFVERLADGAERAPASASRT